MAVITLCSASGSPGVTTTALGLAMTWPRPVMLVEADPTGASGLLAGYFRGGRDDDGLLELIIAARQGLLSARLPELLVELEGTQARILFGSRTHEQHVGLIGVWDELLNELRSAAEATGQDVLVDAGRLGLDGSPVPFVKRSDVTLLMTGSSLRGLAAAASWARSMDQGTEAHYAGVALVKDGGPYGPAEVGRALGLPVLGSLAWDPINAKVFSDGEGFPTASFWKRLRHGSKADQLQFNGSAFMSSIRALGEAARAQAQLVADELAGTPASTRRSKRGIIR